MADGGAPLLEVHGVETWYGRVAALRGIDLQVHAGEVVAVLGANGAGKSTILRTISGALLPLHGSISFGGRSIAGLDPDRVLRLGLGHVPEGREVFPLLTVRQNLAMGAFIRRDRRETARDLDLVFEMFPILRQRDGQRAGLLSGGEQQMLAIGRALMARPRMLLLDEPSLGLSPKLMKEIFGTIARLNREQGVTVLLVEQNAHMALAVAHRGYVLQNGRITFEGSQDVLSRSDDVRRSYLGVGV